MATQISRKEAAKFFLISLFQQADEILKNDWLRGLKDEDYFYGKLRGVTFDNAQEYINKLEEGESLLVEREPDNPVDKNAIVILDKNRHKLGYIKKEIAAVLADAFDKGVKYNCQVSKVTGRDKEKLGLNVYLEKQDYEEAMELLKGIGFRKQLEQLEPDELMDMIRKFLLGKHDYRPKQKESLERLFEKKNTFTIMPTGRGKSAIFQSYATYQAIKNNKMTVIIYPLRALVNDQYEALKRKLMPVGMRVFKGNGSLSEHDKEKLWGAMRKGEIDILLTTPEWLEFHLGKVKGLRDRIGFVVADEAHHIGLDSAAFRPSYQKLNYILRELGNPLTLAVTATANEEVADQIIKTLNIEKVIIDPHVRSNLRIVDKRNLYCDPDRYSKKSFAGSKEDFIVKLIRQVGGKTLVYVNSREKTIKLAEYLREHVPELTDQIAFYNAGMTSTERAQVEDYFRTGEIQVVISTSAFGEGIDNPDIRNVVLYHMNFSFTEFNQQPGRGGRDGQQATIWLLFGEDDKNLNEFILNIGSADRDYMVYVYNLLSKKGYGRVNWSNDDIFEMINALQRDVEHNKKILNSPARVASAVRIMEELGLIDVERDGDMRTIATLPTSTKLDLNNSPTFVESEKEKATFESFSTAILESDANYLLSLINSPIYPKKYLVEEEKALA